MKERIFEIIKRNEFTAWRFAELLEVQPSSISHILSGRNKPSFDFIEKILTRFPEINPDWLILGQGDMIRSGYSDELVIREDEDKKEATLFDLTLDESSESSEITNVNKSDNPIDTDDTFSVITNVIIDKSAKIERNEQDFMPVTDVKKNEVVERVMIFYTNGTFDTYVQK